MQKDKLLEKLGIFLIKNRFLIIIFSGIITAATLCLLPRLKITTDRAELVRSSEPFQKRYREVSSLFGSLLTGVVIFEGEDKEKLKKGVEEFVTKISLQPSVKNLFYKVDINFFKAHGLLYIETQKLNSIVNLLLQVDFERLKRVNTLSDLILSFADLLEKLFNGEIVIKELYNNSPDSLENLKKLISWLKEIKDISYVLDYANLHNKISPKVISPSEYGIDEEGYLVNNDKRSPHLIVVLVQPSSESTEDKVVSNFTNILRKEAKAIAKKYGLKAGVTGMPAIITDEMTAVKKDVRDIVVSAIIFILLLFLVAFRSIRATLLVAIPLIIGLLWTAAFSTLIYTKLTLVSAYFSAVLFGLGIAFGIHFLSRFDEGIDRGKDREEALIFALKGTAPGIITGGTTTAAAFYAIGASRFFGFSQLGIVAGTGVLLMLITTIILFPPILYLWRGKVRYRPLGGRHLESFFQKFIIPYRTVIILTSVIIFLGGVVAIKKLRFDFDPFNLLPQNSESIIYYKKLLSRTNFSSELNIITVSSLKEAEEKRKKLLTLSTVSRVDSISLYIPMEQEEKLSLLRELKEKRYNPIKELVAHFKKVIINPKEITKEELGEALKTLSEVIQDGWFIAKQSSRIEAPYLKELSDELFRISSLIKEKADSSSIHRFQESFFQKFYEGLNILMANLVLEPVTLKTIPKNIRERFVAKKGKEQFAIYIYPKGNIGDIEFLSKFVKECRTIDPMVTGFPVTHYENSKIIYTSFIQSVIYSGLIVALLIFLDFRKLFYTGVALIPLIIGSGWLTLIMVATGIPYNFVNLVTIPIIIGSGVDFGVHLTHRFLREKDMNITIRNTGGAVLLSGLTTIVGFSSMILSRHNGAYSLGILLTLGIIFCIINGVITLPSVIIKLHTKK